MASRAQRGETNRVTSAVVDVLPPPPRHPLLLAMGRRNGARVLRMDRSERVQPLPLPARRLPKSAGLAHHLRTGNLSVVAAAGRDLFRKGLLLDGVSPKRQPPRHPAVRPNLRSIPEDESDGEPAVAVGGLAESRAIVVMGDDRESWPVVERRVEKAAELFWDAQRASAEQQVDSCCYLVPMSESAVEAEQVRNALTKAGVSSHLIVLDCCSMDIANRVVQLVQTLRRLHLQDIHIVSSEFHLPRVRLVVDRILAAAAAVDTDTMRFSTTYHCSVDGLPSVELSDRVKSEHQMLQAAEEFTSDAINALKQQHSHSLVIPRRIKLSVHTGEG